MHERPFENLHLGEKAGPVQLQQPSRQLPKFIPVLSNGELSRPPQQQCHLDYQGCLDSPIAQMGDRKREEVSHSLMLEAISTWLARLTVLVKITHNSPLD
jgi:hypothetical protein